MKKKFTKRSFTILMQTRSDTNKRGWVDEWVLVTGLVKGPLGIHTDFDENGQIEYRVSHLLTGRLVSKTLASLAHAKRFVNSVYKLFYSDDLRELRCLKSTIYKSLQNTKFTMRSRAKIRLR